MSDDAERLRAALEALRTDTSDHDWEATLAGAWVGLWDPRIEWDASTHPLPDLAGVYRGVGPTLRWVATWLAAWEAVQVGYELVDAGDRIVGLFHLRLRGHYTGIDVASGRYAMVFTFRDGLIVRAKFYGRRSEALEAVAVREAQVPRGRAAGARERRWPPRSGPITARRIRQDTSSTATARRVGARTGPRRREQQGYQTDQDDEHG